MLRGRDQGPSFACDLPPEAHPRECATGSRHLLRGFLSPPVRHSSRILDRLAILMAKNDWVKIRYLPEFIGLMARLSPPYDTLARRRAWVSKGRGTKGACDHAATRGIGSRQGTRRDGSVAAGAIGRTGETGQSPIRPSRLPTKRRDAPWNTRTSGALDHSFAEAGRLHRGRRRSDSLSADVAEIELACARCATASARRPRRSLAGRRAPQRSVSMG